MTLATVAGCASPKSGRWKGYDPFPEDSYVMEAPAPADDARLGVHEAIEQALENSTALVLLRRAADVARAQARTWPELRDPELGFTYGEGRRKTERQWLVPRSEIVAETAYGREVLISEHSGDIEGNRDPDTRGVLIEDGGEGDYLTWSSNRYTGTTVDSDMYRLSVRFYPPNPFLNWARGAVNKANYAAALSDVHAAEWQTAAQVKRLFADMGFIHDDLALLERLAEARRVLAETAGELAESRQVPAVDAMAAAQRYVQTLSDQDRARRDLAVSQVALAALVGRRVPAERLDLSGAAPAALSAAHVDPVALQRHVVRRRSDVTASYWRWQAAAAALREARSTRIPWFTRLEASYSHSTRSERPDAMWDLGGGSAELNPRYSLAVDNEEEDEWRVDALVTVPVFSLGPRAQRVPLAEYRRTRAVMDETARSVLAQVDEALAQLRAAEERRARMDSDIGPMLERARGVAEELEARDDLAPSVLARTREVVVEMERTLLRAARDHQLAALALEEAAGVDLP